MKKWITYLICICCTLCSTTWAEVDSLTIETDKGANHHIVLNNDRTYRVGSGSTDGVYATRSDTGKYLVGAVILVVAIAAIIYASRHHNSHSH